MQERIGHVALHALVFGDHPRRLPRPVVAWIVRRRQALPGIEVILNGEETRRSGLHVVTDDTKAAIAKERHEHHVRVGRPIRPCSLMTPHPVAELARSAESRRLVAGLQVLPDVLGRDDHSLAVPSDRNLDRILVSKLRKRAKVPLTFACVHECGTC